ncbi:MAG: OmpA family protein [Flavitalea sp.]
MKKSLAAVLAIVIAVPSVSDAQVRMAVVGGPHQSNVIETNQIPGWDSTTKPGYSGRKSINLGILVDVPFGNSEKWSLQSGFIYHGKGREYFRQNDTLQSPAPDTSWSRNKFQTNYIDVPLNIAYRMKLGGNSSFMLAAGPYISFYYSGKNLYQTRLFPSYKYEEKERNLEVGKEVNKVKTFDLGLNARAGFEMGKILLTGFYSRGLTSFYQAGYDGKFNHEVYGASVGFWINSKKKKHIPVKTIEVVPEAKIEEEIVAKPAIVVETPRDTITQVIVAAPVEKIEITKEIIKKVDIAARQIYFNTGSDRLATGSFAALDEVAQLLKENPGFTLIVEGHTDNIGNDQANKLLSGKRADAVKVYLEGKNIEPSRISAVGYGETKPVKTNDTEEGRKANRRVELKLKS